VKERRQSNRWQINKEARVKLAGAQAFAQCFIKDINLKGFQISLRMKLPQETFLKLNLILTDEFKLKIEAWVVWHRNIGGFNVYGLYFNQIKEQDKEEIYKFVHKYFPKELGKQGTQEAGGEIMQDRRIFARFPVNYSLKFLDLNANSEGDAKSQDISAKGIGLLTNKELKPHTPLEFWLQIPDRGEPLYTRAEVIWSEKLEPNKYRAGVKLDKADLMGMSRIFRA
jgi:c-di-GMP-binding flagellar brake protein YcgR